MPIEAALWYDSNPDVKNLYQGDILEGVPIVITPPRDRRWVILRPRLPGSHGQNPPGLPKNLRADVDSAFPTAWTSPEGELVMAHASIEKIMIITQSCDLDWRKHCQVVPVYPIQTAPESKLDDLRANDVGSWFYLPAAEGLVESYADLTHVTSVSTSYFRPDFLVKRLSSSATAELQNALSSFYARPFGFNTRDVVTQSTLYACAACFYKGKDPHKITPEEGKPFPPCPTCRELALWIKIPS